MISDRWSGATSSSSARSIWRHALGWSPSKCCDAPIRRSPTIIGSPPRPAWHTVLLGSRSFLEAMVNARWREQYEDAVSTHFRAQEVAGLDICTDGDAHYDEEIGGWSWQSYPLTHMAGFSREVALTPPAVAAAAPPRGMILHDQLEARV
jgi:hypothetical protein